MDHIFTGGIYRNADVYISGAQHMPPSPNEMYRQLRGRQRVRLRLPHTEVLSFFQFRFDEREIFVKDSILYFQRI